MTQPIKIYHADNEAEARARHERINKRLDELGHESVKSLYAAGGLPTEWNQIVLAWMTGDKLEPEKAKS